MSKCPSSTTPSPRKRIKLSADQGTLDTFFTQKGEPSRHARASLSGLTKSTSRKPQLARSSTPSTPKPSQSNVGRASPEIIDVDLLDGEPPCPSPPDLEPSSQKESQWVPSTRSEEPVVIYPYPPLGVDPLNFDLDRCPWSTDVAAPYSFLAHTLATLSETRSRIIIVNALTNTLRALLRYHPSSLLPSLYLLTNSLSPPYSPVELGLGPSIISKAIQDVSGLTPAALRRLYNRTGDPGDVAFEAKSKVRTLIPHPPVLIQSLYDALLKIAHAKGSGAMKQKQNIVERLLVSAKGEETRFLVRTLSQHIRVGAVRTTILTALARALVLTPPSVPAELAISSSVYHASPKVQVAASLIDSKASKRQSDIAREDLQALYTSAEALIKRTYVQHPNYDHIVEAILEAGLDGLASRVPLTVGIPLHPTLGSPMRSLEEVYERLQDMPFAAEFKYDGQRAQIHATSDNGVVSCNIFSRHLEDMTDKYPDVVSLVHHIFATNQEHSSFIMDTEIVALDPKDETLRSFQELSNRPRKAVQLQEIQVSVGVFAYDLMFLDGKILLEEPFRTRRAALHQNFPPTTPDIPGAARFKHVEYCESSEGKNAVEEFWLKAVDSRCEGLMIKLLDNGDETEVVSSAKDKTRKKPLPATYEPDKRSMAWLKLKKDYVMSLGDTLDLVPVGAWHGNGRKALWWSPVLLALRDPTTGTLVAMCKCMSGFSDSVYKAMKSRYSEEDSYNCSTQPLWGDVDTGGYRPTVYFRPHEVWEIRGADVTLSPVSIAARGLVSDERGLSLRFPRFIKAREDKNIEQASTPEFLASMWRSQQGKTAQRGADDGDLVDVYLSEEVVEDSDDDE